MQRINWFPDPNITGTAPVGVGNAKVDYPIVNNRKWIRATSTGTGDPHADYALSGSQIPPAGSYHVHALACAQKATAYFIVSVRVGGSYQQLLTVPVGDGQTVTVDQTITIPAGCDRLIVRIGPNSQTVGVIGMMSDILIERADTYDTAVGGASGLLLGGHDAARIGASVGRVVSDDGDELAQASERGHRIWRVERCDRHRERGRDENLLHRQLRIVLPLSEHERDQDHTVLVRRCRPIPGGACGSGGTRRCRAAQWGEGRYLGIPCHPRHGGGKYDVSGFRSGKGLSDPGRVGDLHARRLGEIAVNGSDVVRRGHDAVRLALMGVVA